MGTSLQASPRPKTLPPARRLDCAADSVASIQALAERWLATVAGNQVVRRVRAGELDTVDPFDCISEERVFVKAVCDMCSPEKCGAQRTSPLESTAHSVWTPHNDMH